MNKTIKVIELLNKIANGEGVPKIIRYKNYVFEYYERLDDVYNYKVIGSDSKYLNDVFFIDNILNDEIEIIEIEDNDKLEKMQDFDLTLKETNVTKDLKLTYEGVSKTFNYAWHKIDEIMDHINKIEEKLDER